MSQGDIGNSAREGQQALATSSSHEASPSSNTFPSMEEDRAPGSEKEEEVTFSGEIDNQTRSRM